MSKEATQFVRASIITLAGLCVFCDKYKKEIKGIFSPLVDAFKEMRNQSKAIEDSK